MSSKKIHVTFRWAKQGVVWVLRWHESHPWRTEERRLAPTDKNETLKLILIAVIGLAVGMTIMTVIAKILGR